MIDPAHRIIADLLESRTGQHLAPERLWRIGSALAGLFRTRNIANVEQLVCMLADPRETQLANEVVDALINNETYFFRDHLAFSHLADTILPKLAEVRSRSKSLSIWSAGCSTGQEAISLALIFAEQADQWRDWDISIIGTDVSAQAIAAANTYSYSQFEIQRGLSVMQMLRHFDEQGERWVAKDNLRQMITFEQRSLLDRPPQPCAFDLVLCRNVMLYFKPAVRALTLDHLAGAINPNGVLMLGVGETLDGQSGQFEVCVPGQPFCQLLDARLDLRARSALFSG